MKSRNHWWGKNYSIMANLMYPFLSKNKLNIATSKISNFRFSTN